MSIFKIAPPPSQFTLRYVPCPFLKPNRQMLLFIDTETTGIPKNYKAPASDLANWPRMVQVAWLLADDQEKELESAEHIVKPQGYAIPADAARVHGITTEKALAEGAELATVLASLEAAMGKAQVLVAHNMAFDEKIVGAEFLRAGRSDLVAAKTRRCTMASSTNFCRIPGPYGFKWPKLDELSQRLFGESVAGAHRAGADTRACARCYFELKRLGVM